MIYQLSSITGLVPSKLACLLDPIFYMSGRLNDRFRWGGSGQVFVLCGVCHVGCRWAGADGKGDVVTRPGSGAGTATLGSVWE